MSSQKRLVSEMFSKINMVLDQFRLLTVPTLAILLLASVSLSPYPTGYFRSPIGIPIILAGSFAELRSNHFHSGLDIKTNGQTGYRVYSVADGWISRIGVSPGGFGNALYVTHPNGYVTVYAHLDRFSEEIAAYVKERQYQRESFTQNLFPSRNQFPLTKGDIIAFSGNSGGSSGPHLHFEIRNEKNGWPVNPQLFEFEIEDSRPPRIIRTKLYAIDSGSKIRVHDTRTGGWRVITGGESITLDMKRENGKVKFSRVDLVEAQGRIGFGIQTNDYHDGSTNRLGTFDIKLSANENQLFSSRLATFSFDDTRYINAHVDYADWVARRRWVQRSYVLPGNKLPIYDMEGDGLLNVGPGETYDMRYDLLDASGNETVFEFGISAIQSTEEVSSPVYVDSENGLFMVHDAPFNFETDDLKISMDSGTVYENTKLEYFVSKKAPSDTFSDVHEVLSRSIPVHRRFRIAIRADRVPENLRDKAIIATVRGSNLSSQGGTFENGFITSRVRTFGDFVIAIDDEAPRIKALNISEGKNLVRQSNIRFQIRDDLSGIRNFRGEIDGNWVLFEYDAKYSLLKHTFDGSLEFGTHTVTLNVTDQKGNTATYSASFKK